MRLLQAAAEESATSSQMPRIAPALLRRAASASAHLAALLPACRDLSSAVRELGWIREHVAARAARTTRSRDLPERSRRWLEESLTKQLCIRRGSGEPLQYVLGNQPFGGLDVLCRRGVLIPR